MRDPEREPQPPSAALPHHGTDADPWGPARPPARAVAAGRLRDGSACTLVLQLEQGRWVLYPHGADQLAVEVPVDELTALVDVVRTTSAAAAAPAPAGTLVPADAVPPPGVGDWEAS